MEHSLSLSERKELLRLAREALNQVLTTGKRPRLETAFKRLLEGRGVFVTLRNGKELRGCIGTFGETEPLYRVVQNMAVAAAREDPRFPPVPVEELTQIHLEISVLSKRQPIKTVRDIEIGVHGLCIEQGFHRGVLLPQVPVENGWNREEFLTQVCLKAGLAPDAWERGGIQLAVFTAEVIYEHRQDFYDEEETFS